MTSLLQTIYDEIQIKKDQNSITDDDEEDEKKEQPQVIRTRSKTKKSRSLSNHAYDAAF